MRSHSPLDEVALAERLAHVRWIGGGSGASKSTVARALAAARGMQLYDSDATLRDHVGRSNLRDHPFIHAFVAMGMDERWVLRTPEEMLRTFHAFQGEGFEFIVEDLLALPPEMPILVEGFRLLPRLVAPLLSRAHQAIWLLPSPEVRRMAFDARGFTWTIASQTTNPEQALQNLLTRDAMFTDQLRAEVARLELLSIEITGAIALEEIFTRVSAAID